MKQCFAYARVSTIKQGEGVSLEAQRDAIEAYAQRHNLEIVKWFEEKETAAKKGRPIFNRMLKELHKGKANGLIIHKIDRSARNFADWAKIGDLADAGIDIHFATESLDFRSRGGRLTADIQAVIAADYIRNLRDETIKGLQGRLKQGLYPFRAPIGYLDHGRGQPKTPCPIKAPLISMMFELYASGEYSLRRLQPEMKRRGLLNHNNQQLSLSGIETILSNSFYTGLIKIKRTGRTYRGVHDPIISPHIFQRVQDIKSGRAGPKVTKHNHLFRGLFRCGLCGNPMSPEKQKGRVYYRCHERDCKTKTIREDLLENHIFGTLKKLELSNVNAEKLARKWNEQLHNLQQKDIKKSLILQIDATRQAMGRAADLLIAGTLDNETYLAKKQETSLQLIDLEKQLRELPNPEQIREDNKNFLELLKNLAGLYKMLKPFEKRAMVKNTFSNRLVIGKKPVIEPYNWVTDAECYHSVSYGAPHRDTDRTNISSGDIESIKHVMELMDVNEDSS